MRIIIILVFLFSGIITVLGQKKVQIPMPPKNQKRELQNSKCTYKVKYAVEKRLKFYPFDVAKQIELISYDTGYYSGNTGIKEHKVLDSMRINILTDILFNNFYKREPKTLEGTGCWMPRNAIRFLDANGNKFEHILICFECSNIETSSSKVSVGDPCIGKMDLIKDFFYKSGIEFGVMRK